MPKSRRLGWVIPPEGADPWFDPFVNLIESIDTSAYACREDRNIVLMGGGLMSLTIGTLTWADPIELLAPVTGFLWSIPPGTIQLADGEIFYVTLDRAPSDNATVTALKGFALPPDNNSYLVGIRRTDRIYFRNKAVLLDGESRTILMGNPGDATGFTVAGDGLFATGVTLNVGDGAGLATNADFVAIDLATDPGLEFDAPGDVGKLRVKANPSGALTRGAAGLSVLIDSATLGNPTLALSGFGVRVIGLPLSFNINGSAISSLFTATNGTRLVNGSVVDDLHQHAPREAYRIENVLFNLAGGPTINLGDPVVASSTASRITSADPTTAPLVLGIARTAILAGASGPIVSMGPAVGVLVGAIPGAPYYLQTGGGIGLAVPGTGRIVRVGTALNTTDLFVNIADLGIAH